MKSKRGIELSVNFLVMTILAIAVFSMGIVFVNKIFSTVRGGETKAFGVGILNEAGAEKTFKLDVLFSKAFEPDNDRMCDSNGDGCEDTKDSTVPPDWLTYNTQEHPLKNHEQGSYAIAIHVPKGAQRGTYIYDVNVLYNEDGSDVDDDYDSVQKIWVTVI
ncbi:hypothetical protein J4453_02955 [Candidatus Woesearchaeota archaeon]|nr:hypothetical protein [Candidatus Woesearchaeota archaeon]